MFIIFGGQATEIFRFCAICILDLSCGIKRHKKNVEIGGVVTNIDNVLTIRLEVNSTRQFKS